jgi:glycosyltransferase involved in cell wall biosynthesis
MIPTYNQSRYLRAAIDSALNQSYECKQILVLDDCSDDGTRQIMDEYKNYPEVEYVRHEKNIGRVANYHIGLYTYARGEWVINLDGDDFFIDNSFIETAIKLTEKDKDIVLVSGGRIEVNVSGEVSNEKFASINNASDNFSIVEGNLVFKGIPKKKYQLFHLTSLYHRESSLGIDFYRMNIISSDYESLYRLILGKKVAFISSPVAAWRSHGNNESKSTNIQKLMKNYKMFDSIYAYLNEHKLFYSTQRLIWYVNASSKKYYTNVLSLLAGKRYKDLLTLSLFMLSNYTSAFIKTVFNPKLYIKIITKL